MDARLFELPDADDNYDIQIVSERKGQGGQIPESNIEDGHHDSGTSETSDSIAPVEGGARVSPLQTKSEDPNSDGVHKVTPLPQDMEKMLNEHKDQLRIWDEKIQKEKASSAKSGGGTGGSLRGFLSHPSTGFSQVQAGAAGSTGAQSNSRSEDRSGKIGRGIKTMFGGASAPKK
mmetsp:Transcript_12407/g.27105  ORF Transcript_12407/g.27105 Transcript_12407/m.27105 type:complete len:175 (+) Transcript_12407:500-1024(+)